MSDNRTESSSVNYPFTASATKAAHEYACRRGALFFYRKIPGFLSSVDWHCVSRIHRLRRMYLWKSSHTSTGKALRIKSNAPGSFRHDVTSACFLAKVWYTVQSSTVARSMPLCSAKIPRSHSATVHAQTDECTAQPAVLVGVSHCTPCPEHVVYDSLFQHSCFTHTASTM